MAGAKIDKVTMRIRTKLKGEELETQLAEHMATLRERDRIEESRQAAVKEFKKELKDKDGVIAEQRIILDEGEMGDVEVEVTTNTKGRKSYKRLDTGESIDEDKIPEQMELTGQEGDDEDTPGNDD